FHHMRRHLSAPCCFQNNSRCIPFGKQIDHMPILSGIALDNFYSRQTASHLMDFMENRFLVDTDYIVIDNSEIAVAERVKSLEIAGMYFFNVFRCVNPLIKNHYRAYAF